MSKVLLYFIVLLLLGGAVYYALSGKREAVSETRTIDQMTDQAAKEMVDNIRIPIENAQNLKDQEEKRVREMEEGLEK